MFKKRGNFSSNTSSSKPSGQKPVGAVAKPKPSIPKPNTRMMCDDSDDEEGDINLNDGKQLKLNSGIVKLTGRSNNIRVTNNYTKPSPSDSLGGESESAMDLLDNLIPKGKVWVDNTTSQQKIISSSTNIRDDDHDEYIKDNKIKNLKSYTDTVSSRDNAPLSSAADIRNRYLGTGSAPINTTNVTTTLSPSKSQKSSGKSPKESEKRQKSKMSKKDKKEKKSQTTGKFYKKDDKKRGRKKLDGKEKLLHSDSEGDDDSDDSGNDNDSDQSDSGSKSEGSDSDNSDNSNSDSDSDSDNDNMDIDSGNLNPNEKNFQPRKRKHNTKNSNARLNKVKMNKKDYNDDDSEEDRPQIVDPITGMPINQKNLEGLHDILGLGQSVKDVEMNERTNQEELRKKAQQVRSQRQAARLQGNYNGNSRYGEIESYSSNNPESIMGSNSNMDNSLFSSGGAFGGSFLKKENEFLSKGPKKPQYLDDHDDDGASDDKTNGRYNVVQSNFDSNGHVINANSNKNSQVTGRKNQDSDGETFDDILNQPLTELLSPTSSCARMRTILDKAQQHLDSQEKHQEDKKDEILHLKDEINGIEERLKVCVSKLTATERMREYCGQLSEYIDSRWGMIKSAEEALFKLEQDYCSGYIDRLVMVKELEQSPSGKKPVPPLPITNMVESVVFSKGVKSNNSISNQTGPGPGTKPNAKELFYNEQELNFLYAQAIDHRENCMKDRIKFGKACRKQICTVNVSNGNTGNNKQKAKASDQSKTNSITASETFQYFHLFRSIDKTTYAQAYFDMSLDEAINTSVKGDLLMWDPLDIVGGLNNVKKENIKNSNYTDNINQTDLVYSNSSIQFMPWFESYLEFTDTIPGNYTQTVSDDVSSGPTLYDRAVIASVIKDILVPRIQHFLSDDCWDPVSFGLVRRRYWEVGSVEAEKIPDFMELDDNISPSQRSSQTQQSKQQSSAASNQKQLLYRFSLSDCISRTFKDLNLLFDATADDQELHKDVRQSFWTELEKIIMEFLEKRGECWMLSSSNDSQSGAVDDTVTNKALTETITGLSNLTFKIGTEKTTAMKIACKLWRTTHRKAITKSSSGSNVNSATEKQSDNEPLFALHPITDVLFGILLTIDRFYSVFQIQEDSYKAVDRVSDLYIRLVLTGNNNNVSTATSNAYNLTLAERVIITKQLLFPNLQLLTSIPLRSGRLLKQAVSDTVLKWIESNLNSAMDFLPDVLKSEVRIIEDGLKSRSHTVVGPNLKQ